jgi:putative lipoic acid-binding regulatory protein
MKTAATIIEAKRVELLKRMREIMDKYEELNDAEWVLANTIADIRRKAKAYGETLSAPLVKFFYGDGRSYSQIDQIVWDAQTDFEKALAQFDIEIKVPRTDKMLRAIRQEYTTRVMGQVNNTFRDVVTKAVQFKTLATSAELATVAQANESKVLREVTINGTTYDGAKVDNIWQQMTDRYGRTDTVRYTKNGAGYNFPMRSYIDMRTQTTAGEVARMVSAVEASANDIYTGKISRHGATDSCSKWEGKIIFYSQVAKDEFLAKYPQYDGASDWATLQDVEADKTHMFLPNCKHRVLPYPLHLIPSKRAESDIAQNTMPDEAAA